VNRPSWVCYYRSRDGQRFLLYQAFGLAASAVALCAAFGDGRLDVAISRWFFDAAHHSFPLTNTWLLKTVLHDAARTMSVLAALTLVATTAASWLMTQSQHFREYRWSLLLVSATCLAGAAAVTALKHFSSHACPWNLTIFGGTVSYHAMFDEPMRAQIVDGCSPAAHPLAGYAWLGIGFALWPAARRHARRAWAAAFVLGSVLGAVQIMRGAHFLSHVLWSAWVVWNVDIALLTAFRHLPARLVGETDFGAAGRPITDCRL
jgi:membrane-associated PAP2 superfamily phosphatase